MRVLAAPPHPERAYPYDDEMRDLASSLVWTVESLFSPAECVAMIERFEKLGCAPAPISVGGGFEMRPDVRNNSRVIFDDLELAQSLFERIKADVPPKLFRDPLTVCGVNERFRGYRYDPGERFNAHYDGRFQRNAREVSLVTFMIYLNEDFRGGATLFHDLDLKVVPRTGCALFFQHAQRHEGCVIESGRKYVLRTDVMYTKSAD